MHGQARYVSKQALLQTADRLVLPYAAEPALMPLGASLCK
jgi:hypothetical protein